MAIKSSSDLFAHFAVNTRSKSHFTECPLYARYYMIRVNISQSCSGNEIRSKPTFAILCHAFCSFVEPNKAQNSALGPMDPPSTLIGGRAARDSRCRPWLFSSPAHPFQHLLSVQATKHLSVLHLENDVLYIIT